MTTATQICRVAAALTLACGVIATTTIQFASASNAASIRILGAAHVDAADVKSRGTIRTPVVQAVGATLSQKSFTIKRGSRVVARTVSQAKAYRLVVGTYTVITRVSYRNFTDKKVSTGRTVTGWKPVNDKPAWSSWDDGAAMPSDDTSPLLFWNECVEGEQSRDGFVTYFSDSICSIDDGRTYRGLLYRSEDDGSWGFDPQDIRAQVPEYRTVRTYSAPRTTSRTQTIKINNSGVMTRREYSKIKKGMRTSKVRSIVGGGGEVVSDYTVGRSRYVTRAWYFDEWDYHSVSYRNGKVYAKSWR